MKRPEDILQASIVQWLQANRYFFFSTPNEGVGAGSSKQQAIIRTMQLVTLGLRKGAPDLVVPLSNKDIVFLECKDPIKGKQSDAQIHFESRLKELGHEYHIVKYLEDVIKIFKDGKRR